MSSEALLGVLFDARDPRTSRDLHEGISADLSAVSAIARAADDGNSDAASFARSCTDSLGEAFVRRARSRRLLQGSAMAAAMGYPALARMGAEAAQEELLTSREAEAGVAGAVRRAHAKSSFGFLTPEETRQLSREKFQEGASTAQREEVFDRLVAKMWEGSLKSGAEMKYGGDSSPDSEDVISAACAAFGGDVQSVFGEGFFKKLAKVFGPNAKKLNKRLETLQARLEKIEDSGDDKDSEVKSIKARIAKIKAKLSKLEDAHDEVGMAADDARVIVAAEESAMTPHSVLGAVDDEAIDQNVLSEMEVFGVSPRRLTRLKKRLETIQKNLEKARDAGDEKKVAKLERRLARMEKRIEALSKSTEKAGKPVDVDSATSSTKSVPESDDDLDSDDGEGDESLGADDADAEMFGEDDEFGATVSEFDHQISEILRPYMYKLVWYVTKLRSLGRQHDALVRAGKDSSSVDEELRDLFATAGIPASALRQLEEVAADRDEVLSDLDSGAGSANRMVSDGLFGAVSDEVSSKPARTVGVHSVARLQRRLDKLKGLLAKAEEAGRDDRAAKISRRIAHVQAQLQKSQTLAKGPEEDETSSESLTTKDPKVFTASEFVDSYFGFDRADHLGVSEDVAPLVGYFAQRAERYGLSQEAAFGGLFKKAGLLASNIVSGRAFQTQAKKKLGLKPGYYLSDMNDRDLFKVMADARVLRVRDLTSTEAAYNQVRPATDEEIRALSAVGRFVGTDLGAALQKISPSRRTFSAGDFKLPNDNNWLYRFAADGTMSAYRLTYDSGNRPVWTLWAEQWPVNDPVNRLVRARGVPWFFKQKAA